MLTELLNDKNNKIMFIIVILYIFIIIPKNNPIFYVLISSIISSVVSVLIVRKYLLKNNNIVENYKIINNKEMSNQKCYTQQNNQPRIQYNNDVFYKPKTGNCPPQKGISDFTEIDFCNFKSINQALAGNANPKTCIKPIIVNRSHDLPLWRKNDTVNFSQLNTKSTFDEYTSGYNTVINPIPNISSNLPRFNKFPVDYSKPSIYTTNIDNNIYVDNSCNQEPINSNIGISMDYQRAKNEYLVNKSVKQCANSNPLCSDPNINVQDGEVYIKKYPVEPITIYENYETNDKQIKSEKLYEEIDPVETYEVDPVESTSECNKVDRFNVYDPRFTGYASSNRAYTDKMLGQTRYYYDDINNINMPNYIVRSNIDNVRGADNVSGLDWNTNTNNIRDMANRGFIEQTNQFRVGLQNSLMEKRNREMAQLRQYPINRNSRNTGRLSAAPAIR